ncbi:hypothetical protein GGR57DRAFT_464579 [Xylariaceae sp. FL1272]|nr:hypothetical protein GGR57DRAFT_464579 [Xylariaceae sp. FL1272]
MSSPIRIAIIGGGLAGASLIHALLPRPNIDVHIFESAADFRESGLAIGITRNAQAALDLVGPPGQSAELLKRAGAVPLNGVRFMIAQREGQGEVVDEVDANDEKSVKRLTSIVHRADYLKQLFADVPRERMHASKKLSSVENNSDGSVTVKFQDGSVHLCDIVIGADGVRSTVRKLILGPDDPAVAPRNTGDWCIMALVSYKDGLEALGPDLVDATDAREYGWMGNNSFMLHNVLSGGELVQFVIGSTDKDAENSDRWARTVKATEIRKMYAEWPEKLKMAVDKLLCQPEHGNDSKVSEDRAVEEREHRAMYLWEHPPASTYASGALCVMGDAAHATTAWQSSGGGMAIEDSMILSTLIGMAKNPAEARVALKVYDEVRRPRTQRIVESSRRTGTIILGNSEKTGLDWKNEGNFLSRWDFIIDVDMQGHRDGAVEMMEAMLSGDGAGT